MRADTRERAEAIAEFLAKEGRGTSALYLRVGEAAAIPDCPVRPPKEAEWVADYGDSVHPGHRWVEARPAAEPHCQRVTAALNAAVKLGLVEKTRTGKGPWLYRALTGGGG